MDYKLALNQLAMANNGMNRLVAMVGAKNFVASKEDNYVSFKFMKGAANKANYMKITLNGKDLYDVEFGRIWGMDYKVMSEHNDVYFDQLKELFENETKLYLSF